MAPSQSTSAAPKPFLEAALLCDATAVDRSTGKKSLLGIFDTVMLSRFPGARVFSLYVRIVGAEGPYEFQARLVDCRTGAILAQGVWQAVVLTRFAGADYTIDFPPVELPDAGRYEFRIYANQHFIGIAPLDARNFPAVNQKEAA